MELLSPAGNLEVAMIALNAGADAIYIGGKNFSARMSADNFSDEEMKKIIAYAHIINKKVYVTMNTLIYQDEFKEAVEYARFLHSLNVDGLIIQDVGFAFYLHQVFPFLPLHASTQLNCHNIDQAKALKKLGFVRIVIAREAPLSFVKQVKALGLEVEVFAHGALCVAYSGNCLMSSFIGNRSGNRGKCAQPCRMKYALHDGENKLKDPSYALSTKDLMTLHSVDKYLSYGVDSMKLEGRLKQNEYVFSVTKSYRRAIDDYYRNNKNAHYDADLYVMRRIFNRDFTKGYVLDENRFSIINNLSSSHQGEQIGYVINQKEKSVFIKLIKDVARLDGIRFNNVTQYGLTISKMYVNTHPVELAKKGQIIELKIPELKGNVNHAEVIRTTDNRLEKALKLEMQKKYNHPITGKFIAYPNKPITLEIKDGDIRILKTGDICEVADNVFLTKERIAEQLLKTGNYPFSLEKIDIRIGNNIFINLASLNALRNEALDELVKTKARIRKVTALDYTYHYEGGYGFKQEIKATVLNNNQYNLLKENGIEVFKINDEENNMLERVEVNPRYGNNNNMVHFITTDQNHLIASPYCNITNSYALDAFYFLGFEEIIPSLELDFKSLKMMINDFINRHHHSPKLGYTVYGHIDLMIMKSCPVGTLYQNRKDHCNKCHERQLYLKDRMKVDFPLYGDKYCNIHILNSYPLYLLDKIEELKSLGIQNFYLDFKLENSYQIKEILRGLNSSNIVVDRFTRGHYTGRAL